jgi:threonylcarbamoyladenosine tRNA methylthiotransferase MtaB
VDASRADSVAVVALGCRVGRTDVASTTAALGPGFREARAGEGADWVLVATCSVTADAAASSRKAVRRAAREHPGARILVAGCHASFEGAALGRLPGVVAVVEPRDHASIPGLVARLRAGDPPEVAIAAARAEAPGWDAPPDPAAGPARPVLKIQDGCDARCAYCAVPIARGASRSLGFDESLTRVAAVGKVRPEVVLAGVHLGAWGADLSPRRDLAALLRAVAETRAVRRVRLSSLEPLDLPLGLLGEEAGEVLCEHFHLPLQSGSDRVLAAMGRPYRASGYARVVEAVLRARPLAAVGADVLTGFPGETEADHRETLALLAGLPFSLLHVFPFSPRPGTVAAAMAGQVPAAEVARRSEELREQGARSRTAFLEGLRGRELEVVVERVLDGVASGTSREYAHVRFPARGSARGDLVRVRAGDAVVDLDHGVARIVAPS